MPYTGLEAEPQPAYYLRAVQNARGDYYVVMRAGGDPASLGSAARAAVWSIDPELPVGQMRTMDERLRESIGAQTFRTTLSFRSRDGGGKGGARGRRAEHGRQKRAGS